MERRVRVTLSPNIGRQHTTGSTVWRPPPRSRTLRALSLARQVLPTPLNTQQDSQSQYTTMSRGVGGGQDTPPPPVSFTIVNPYVTSPCFPRRVLRLFAVAQFAVVPPPCRSHFQRVAPPRARNKDVVVAVAHIGNVSRLECGQNSILPFVFARVQLAFPS